MSGVSTFRDVKSNLFESAFKGSVFATGKTFTFECTKKVA